MSFLEENLSKWTVSLGKLLTKKIQILEFLKGEFLPVSNKREQTSWWKMYLSKKNAETQTGYLSQFIVPFRLKFSVTNLYSVKDMFGSDELC